MELRITARSTFPKLLLLLGVVLKRAEDAGPDKAYISSLPTKPWAELLSPWSTGGQGGTLHLCRAVPQRSRAVGGWVAPKLTHPVILSSPSMSKAPPHQASKHLHNRKALDMALLFYQSNTQMLVQAPSGKSVTPPPGTTAFELTFVHREQNTSWSACCPKLFPRPSSIVLPEHHSSNSAGADSQDCLILFLLLVHGVFLKRRLPSRGTVHETSFDCTSQ